MLNTGNLVTSHTTVKGISEVVGDSMTLGTLEGVSMAAAAWPTPSTSPPAVPSASSKDGDILYVIPEDEEQIKRRKLDMKLVEEQIESQKLFQIAMRKQIETQDAIQLAMQKIVKMCENKCNK